MEQFVDYGNNLYLKEINNYPLLSSEEEVYLAKEIENENEEAKKRFTEANLCYVVNIAKRYIGLGMDLEDLIQEGNLGLIKTVEKFDYRKGCRFITYADYWIRQSIIRALEQKVRVVPLPVAMEENIRKINRVKNNFMLKNFREPTEEELANEMNMSEAEIRDIQKFEPKEISLDAPIEEEQETNLYDVLPNPHSIIPSEQPLSSDLTVALQRLSEREQKIISLRYGLKDNCPKKQDEVAAMLGVSYQRIGAIERRALKKLKGFLQEKTESVNLLEPKIDVVVNQYHEFKTDYVEKNNLEEIKNEEQEASNVVCFQNTESLLEQNQILYSLVKELNCSYEVLLCALAFLSNEEQEIILKVRKNIRNYTKEIFYSNSYIAAIYHLTNKVKEWNSQEQIIFEHTLKQVLKKSGLIR